MVKLVPSSVSCNREYTERHHGGVWSERNMHIPLSGRDAYSDSGPGGTEVLESRGPWQRTLEVITILKDVGEPIVVYV